MTDEPKIPQMEKVSKEYDEWTQRHVRREFVDDIQEVLKATPTPTPTPTPPMLARLDHFAKPAITFSRAEQAQVLRKIADQIEREAGGNPVQRSLDRVNERDRWPNRAFFQKTPAKPSPEMAERWKQDGRTRAEYWAERAQEKAAEAQPMAHFVKPEQERDR